MAFNKKECMKWDNPYEHLSTGDELAEHSKELNNLNPEEKTTLATKIIKACPSEEFQGYRHHINGSRIMIVQEETFYSVLADAYQVRKRIEDLSNPLNPTPHKLLLGEFNLNLFERFKDLAQYSLKGKELGIAERLVLCIPEQQAEAIRATLEANIQKAFPDTNLISQIKTAFTLQDCIKNLLLGQEPETFFTPPNFNRETCAQFMTLCRALLNNKEEAIGIRLFNRLTSDQRVKILHSLALLSSEIHDQANPFKWIASALSKAQSTSAFTGVKSPQKTEKEEEQTLSNTQNFN